MAAMTYGFQTVRKSTTLIIFVIYGICVQAASDSESSEWFFERPTIEQLQNSPHKVFAHYFSQFPVSIDNKPADIDYYTKGYLAPDGENGKHQKYGGYIRERPLPRPPRSEEDWRLIDKMEEVRLAREAGLDGFTFDVLATNGYHWDNLLSLLEAAQRIDPNFGIILMPDMLADLKNHPEQMVPAIETLASKPSVYHLADGRLVLCPYYPNAQTPLWWQQQLTTLANAGIRVALIPVFQGWQTQIKAYSNFVYGVSDWGVSNADDVYNRGQSADKIHAISRLWMAPIRPQDFRPKDFLDFESHNTELFRKMWEIAINEHADWAQVITWNDYSEGSEIEPSTQIGTVFYDLCAYYTTWFKLGRPPKILHDAIYYTYRIERTSEKPDLHLQGKVFSISGSRAYNEIELLGFLTAPGVLEIEINGQIFRKVVDRGIQVFRVPLIVGKPIFRLIRNSQTVLACDGAWQVTDNISYQNLLYHGGKN